jgi:AbiJ N-terminal domain 5
MITHELGQRILALRDKVVAQFDANDWAEVGLITGHTSLIQSHPRLLRSLSWGDEDYAGNALSIIGQIAEHDPKALEAFERHANTKYPDETQFISAKPAERKITFAPNVFQVPENPSIERDLVALMMPFDASFAPTHQAIKRACAAAGYRCLRVDDIWEESTVIQDIFNLIFKAHVVISDFSNKNPNVMYETGIAHTLGKHVVPISQSLDDIPFDMKHHRVLKYLANGEGLASLESKLAQKLRHVSQ